MKYKKGDEVIINKPLWKPNWSMPSHGDVAVIIDPNSSNTVVLVNILKNNTDYYVRKENIKFSLKTKLMMLDNGKA